LAGRIIVLSAENDPTQSKVTSCAREAVWARREVVSMGNMGHAAALFDPDKYVEMLEGSLG
jgi:hypothetical protein